MILLIQFQLPAEHQAKFKQDLLVMQQQETMISAVSSKPQTTRIATDSGHLHC